MCKGKVWLVGAGPGDIGLLTKRAIEVIEQADFIAYDALVGDAILCMLPEKAEKVSVGKRSGKHSVLQEETNQLILREALKGKKVVRLKGGDPFVFGRGGEELELLVRHEVPFEVVPGVTSAVAVPAYAGIPVTHRDYNSSFHVITGHPRKDGSDRIDYDALVRMDATLVFLMSIHAMGRIMEQLMQAGMNPNMPAAVLEQGTHYCQRRVVSTVRNLERDAKKEGIQTPAIIIVGKVCSLSGEFAWYERKALANIQVIVTRTRDRAGRLTKELRDAGAEVLEIPMIATEPIDPERVELYGLMEEAAGREVWLVFTSPTGVKTFFGTTLAGKRTDLRKLMEKGVSLRFAVIGEATEKELASYGWIADLMPEIYNGKELGKMLAKTVSENAVIYLLRAKEGSDELKSELKAAKIDYKDISIYETACREHSPLADIVTEKIEKGQVDWVTFTSVSTVRGFVQTMRELDFEKVHALCIGEQTAKEAGKHHMQVEVSKQATIASMVDRLKELCPEHEGE